MAELSKRQDKKLIYGIPQFEFLIIVIVHICALLTFINNSAINTVAGLIAIGATCLLLFNPHLYLLLPVYMIFYEQIVPISGLVGYRIYTLVVIASCLKVKISVKNIAILLFLLAYTFYSIYPYAPGRVPMCVINFLFLVLYFEKYMKDKKNYMNFFGFFIFSVVLSAIYGLFRSTGMASQMMVDGKYIEYNRFLATFNDPNYLGLMFNVAIFANLCLGFFKHKRGMAALIICYVALLATLSITAILVNIVCLLFYFVVVKKTNLLIIPITLVILIVVVFGYKYALKNDLGFVTDFAYRIYERIAELEEGNLSTVTSGRNKIVNKNLSIFANENWIKQLLGGNYLTSIGRDKSKFSMVSHNEFVDNLLVFGIIGTVFYWIYFVQNIRATLKKVEGNSGMKWTIIMMKIIYLIYCFSLTIFPDIRLLFLFFL